MEIEATRLGDGKVAFVLLFKSTAETRTLWPFDFELVAPGLGNPVNCKVAGYAPSRSETESFPQPMR